MKHFLLLLLLFPVICFAQGDQTIINVPIDGNGTTEQAILHLPDDYKTSSTKYPLLVFLHGTGEGGSNPATIYTSSSAGGPAYIIAQGQWPSSFVNPADKQSYKFIVVSPQSTNGWSTYAGQLDYVLTYLYNTYRADPARLYLTGISAGGEGITEYCGAIDGNGNPVTTTHKVAAMVPMSAVTNAPTMNPIAQNIANSNIEYWGFGSLTDVWGVHTIQIQQQIDVDKPNLAISTTYSGGHCCWEQFYTPTYTQNGMNIYQWMLQYTQGSSAASSSGSSTSTSTPGSSIYYTLPGTVQAENYALMSGVGTESTSDAGGGLDVDGMNNGDWTKYQVTVPAAGWYTVGFRVATASAGGSLKLMNTTGAVLCTVELPNTGGLQDWLTVTTTVNLQAGSQTLTLQSTSADDWSINWLQFAPTSSTLPGGMHNIPGSIEAASYEDATGNIATQPTSDVGGGYNVGWIDYGRYMDYYVNVEAYGTYTVSFRVATIYSDASFELLDANGNVLTTVTAPNTGGFQTWQTVSAKATLQAGLQTIRLQSTSWDIWNINWMQFASGTTGAATAANVMTGAAVSMVDSVATPAASASVVWPNPVKGLLNIQVNDNTSGDRIIQVVDALGVVRQTTKVTKTPGLNQFQLDVSGLSTGVYNVRILSTNRQETIKILKL